jgi:hypothetical protein
MTLKRKTELVIGLLLVVLLSNAILLSSCREYSYEIIWNTGELTRWRGHLWTIETGTKFPARSIVKSSINVDAQWYYMNRTYDEKEITPRAIVRTSDKIYMLFMYEDFAPSNANRTTVNVFITGELETGETFILHGPGPGFMRRP